MAYLIRPPAGCPRRTRDPAPEDRICLGRLKGLIYSPGRDGAGRRRTYIHFMETPPRLACNPEGTQLYILGGRYRVGPGGIEG